MSDLQVSLVIPGRNSERTIARCLDAVVAISQRGNSRLKEIIFVDDGSTDRTAEIVRQYPVTHLRTAPRGSGAARNAGWRAAQHELVWFVDSDCVAEPDALDVLLPYFDDESIAGAGGSYGNLAADSLLACLIHEEIIERHRRMPSRVNFLAGYNVLYRRDLLVRLGGFNESFILGQDAELAWRFIEAGYELAFDMRSKVSHFHPERWRAYLRKQFGQGHWRVRLHLLHRGHALADSYSNWVDHVQPPLAAICAISAPLIWCRAVRWVPICLAGVLAACQIPMTWRLLCRTRQVKYVCFGLMSTIRAFFRGVGLCAGVLSVLLNRRAPTQPSDSSAGGV